MKKFENTSSEARSTRVNTTYLNSLMDKLEPFLDYKHISVNTRFTLFPDQEHKCFFLKSGVISMYRQPNDILIDIFEAPSIRGFIHRPNGLKSLYILKMITPCEVAIIDRSNLFALLTEHACWELFAMHQLEINSVAAERIFNLVTPSVYDAVRLQLYELINSSAEVRESITAESYIRSKTKVSRSSIMRILTDLKEGGYIVIERGKIKEIIKLPGKYYP